MNGTQLRLLADIYLLHGLWEGLTEECVRVCLCAHLCVCLARARSETESECSVFALLCGELSIVTGAESGLQLPT